MLIYSNVSLALLGREDLTISASKFGTFELAADFLAFEVTSDSWVPISKIWI